MKPFRQLLRIMRSIQEHPLASRHKLLAYYRFLSWQAVSRLFPRGIPVNFTPRTKLLVRKGMTGATGNVYMGLHEFTEMAFLLHFLRKDDVFVDVGANVGSYTILAAAHVGCRTWAFEPIPATFESLQANIRLNKATAQVRSFACAVGAQAGYVQITATLDTVNHVLPEWENGAVAGIKVPVLTIDEALPTDVHPALIKIDVEGFESEVLAGMQGRLRNAGLLAVIIELNGSGARYGFQDESIHRLLMQYDFQPFDYDPFSRKLQPKERFGLHNTLYLRQVESVQERLQTSPQVRIFREVF